MKPNLFSHALVQILQQEGFSAAFGIPGGSLTPIYQALVDSPQITTVLCQHETSAVYMAMGYTVAEKKNSRRMALCFGTSGAGMTNLLTGSLSAQAECLPLLILTGNVSSHLFGKGAVQDSSEYGLGIEAFFKNTSVESFILRDLHEQTESEIRALIKKMKRLQKPVHLSIPVDFGMRDFELQSQESKPTVEVQL